MNETAADLKRTIVASHEALEHNLAALETKARELGDWRVQFDKRPFAVLGLAFAGGLLAAAVLGGSRSRRRAPEEPRPESPPRPRKASGSWDRLQGALGAVASAAALDLLHEAVPGLKQRLTDPVREHLARTPTSSALAFQDRGAPPLSRSNGFNSPDVA